MVCLLGFWFTRCVSWSFPPPLFCPRQKNRILLRCTRKGSFILNLRCRYAHGSILFRLLCFSRWFNVAGGKDHNNRAFRAAEVYDVEEDKWKILPPMSQARIECQGVFMDGKFIVISGYYGWIDRFSRSAEVFDTGEGVWSRVENMWSIGGCPKSCIPASGHLFCFQNLQVMSYNSEHGICYLVHISFLLAPPT